VVVSSPAVGVYHDAPRVGEVLVGGSRAGRLTQLGRTVDLIMPPGAEGRVAARALRHRAAPVEYGEALLRLEAVEVEGGATEEIHQGTDHDLPQGTFAITSPTHGVFYRRPGPGEPAYVETGDVVEEGTTVALVEVMKCFSAIAYRGEGFPARAEVVEVRAGDGDEVEADQVLLVMKPT
jgi:biotin carboxyl carrier protein